MPPVATAQMTPAAVARVNKEVMYINKSCAYVLKPKLFN